MFQRIICTSCGWEKDVPVYCGDRFCPVCTGPRRARVREKMKFILSRLINRPGYRTSHLTLTIKNTADLKEGLRFLQTSFKRLRARRSWKVHVAGGMFVFEVTGKPGDWHPHLHVILHSAYYPQHLLLRQWRAIVKLGGVFIKQVPHKTAVAYLTKYVSKSEVATDLIPLVSQTLKDFRMFQPFGTFFAICHEWKKPPTPCPACGQTHYMPLDILLRQSNGWHDTS